MNTNSNRENNGSQTWIDRVYEPTKTDLRGPGRVDDLWFHNGEELTILQRIGFLFFCITSLGFGIFQLIQTIKLFRQLDLTMLVTAPIGAVFTYVGVRILRNVLRFKSGR
jgi:hypothetical protein